MDQKKIKAKHYSQRLQSLIDLKKSARFELLESSEKSAIDVAISAIEKFIKLNNFFYDEDENEEPGRELQAIKDRQITYQALKKWRSGIASDNDFPAYMIFNNKTLEEISKKSPKTLLDLESIHGIGPSKIEKYGDQVLHVVNKINNQIGCEIGSIKENETSKPLDSSVEEKTPKSEIDDQNNIKEEDALVDENITFISREEFVSHIALISEVFAEELNENIILEKISDKFSLIEYYIKKTHVSEPDDLVDKYNSIERKFQALNEFILILDDIQDIIDIEESNDYLTELRNLSDIFSDIPLKKRIEKEIRSLNEEQESLPSRQQFSYQININKAISTLERNAPTCSSCGSKMVIRSGKDNNHFWGCSTFPTCFGRRWLTREQLDLIPEL